jgi:hypothetical protein
MRIDRLVVINNDKLDSTDNKGEDEDKDEAKATHSGANLSSA